MTIARSVAQSVAQSVARGVASLGSSGGVVSNLLFVSFGESNSGGYALNSEASTWELSSRSELQFWNVNINVFQNMDIGTNNNLDHAGLDSTTHGWELGIANCIKRGFLGDKSCYYVQTGQGASKVVDWDVGNGSGFWTKFLSRTTAAKAAMPGAYSTYVWLTLGINDAIAGTPISTATYKAGILDLIARIKVQLPGCKFLIHTLPTINSAQAGYNTALGEIVAGDSTCTLMNVESPVTLQMRDSYHWSYAGMKRMAARGVDVIRQQLGLPSKLYTWSTRGDVGQVYFTAANDHSHVSTALSLTTAGTFMFELSAAGETCILAMDSDFAEVNWGNTDPYFGGAYVFGGAAYRTNSNGTATAIAGVTPPVWARFRWTAGGSDLILDTSTDGGSTWSAAYTFTGAVSGQSTAYIKVLSASGAGSIDAWM